MTAASDSDERHKKKKSKKEKKNKVKKSKRDKEKKNAASEETPDKKSKLKLRLTLSSKKPQLSSGSEGEDSPRAAPSTFQGKRVRDADGDNDGGDWVPEAKEDGDEWDDFNSIPPSPTTELANMTKRQRVAFLARSGQGLPEEVDDESVPSPPSREGGQDDVADADVAAERQAQKQESARKRRLLLDLQEEEIKKQTIDKLLNKQTSSRLRKEEEDAENMVANRDRDRKIEGPMIRHVSNSKGEFVTFPSGYKIIA